MKKNLIQQNIKKWFLPQTNSRNCCKGSHKTQLAAAFF
jgi:hypothetical protein